MTFQDCLIVERHDDWLVMVGDKTDTLAIDVAAEELVTCARLLIELTDLGNVRCVLAPASTSCFFATLDAGEEIDLRDRAALTYELEDHLPIDAESMVADFVVMPSSPRRQASPESSAASEAAAASRFVSAVAITVDRWREIADAFEDAGIAVRSIVPAAVLAARSVCRDVSFTESIDLLLVDETRCDLLTVQSDSIASWKHTITDPNVLRRHQLLDASESEQVVVIGATPNQESSIQSVYGDPVFLPETVESHRVHGAELLLANQSQRWFDLRRDQLGPSDPLRPILTQLRLLALATAVCLVAMVVGGWWRTQRIESEIANVREQQNAVFREAFPNTKIPGAILRRVRSEHARVMGCAVRRRKSMCHNRLPTSCENSWLPFPRTFASESPTCGSSTGKSTLICRSAARSMRACWRPRSRRPASKSNRP